MQEIVAALRQFRKNPGFVVTVVLTLALGIGANTAIFTLVHAVLLRSLPVQNPNGLYRIGKDNTTAGIGDGLPENGDFSLFSWDLYRYMQGATPQFSSLAAVQSGPEGLAVRAGQSQARNERIEYVSGNYFQTLGVQPFAGRLLTHQDDRPGAAPAVVLSYAAWQADYGSNPHIVGSTLTMQQHPVTVIGIGPEGFYGDRVSSAPAAFWVPLGLEPMLEGSFSVLHKTTTNWLYLLGRLRPGVAAGALQAQMTANLQHWLMAQPSLLKNGGAALIRRQHITLAPGGGGVQQMQQSESAGLYLLLAISALVLLVACANVANLLLARGAAQRAAISLRMALGAGRRRIVRQMLVESVLLACLGGAAGLVVAYAGAQLILSLAFPDSPLLPIHASPSPAVLGFSFLLSLCTGLLFGVAPAWITSRADPAEALRGVNRSTRDSAATPQRILIIFQAALSLVLLVSAGLLTRSLAHLEDQNLGIQPANRYIVSVDPAGAGYTVGELPELYRALTDRFSADPTMAHVGLALYSPLAQVDWSTGINVVGRRPAPAGSQEDVADFDRVNAGFFAAVGEPLVQGRDFSAEDTGSTQPVAVVNQAFARHFFPGRNPIGLSFSQNSRSTQIRIIGVAADAAFVDPTAAAARPMFLLSFNQPPATDLAPNGGRDMFLSNIILDFRQPPASVDSLVRRTLQQINPNLSVISVKPFADQIDSNFTQNRLLARLAGLFGLLALVLAAVGLYGILAYQVARRTREIGVRMALGARRGGIVGMVLREALAQVGIGLVIGTPVAVLAGHLIASQLFGVQAYDPVSYAIAFASLGAAALLAAAIPARRAAGIEPVVALRVE